MSEKKGGVKMRDLKGNVGGDIVGGDKVSVEDNSTMSLRGQWIAFIIIIMIIAVVVALNR